jgi:hypothetical protein
VSRGTDWRQCGHPESFKWRRTSCVWEFTQDTSAVLSDDGLERKPVQNIYTVVSWLADNRLAAAAFFFGGAAVAVMVYTYFVDYRLLPEQE